MKNPQVSASGLAWRHWLNRKSCARSGAVAADTDPVLWTIRRYADQMLFRPDAMPDQRRRAMRHAHVPPNANELDIAAEIVTRRATLGT